MPGVQIVHVAAFDGYGESDQSFSIRAPQKKFKARRRQPLKRREGLEKGNP